MLPARQAARQSIFAPKNSNRAPVPFTSKLRVRYTNRVDSNVQLQQPFLVTSDLRSPVSGRNLNADLAGPARTVLYFGQRRSWR